ncbi:MAG: YjiH family protein [Calditrichaeota bacterium]|nr:MAG: YjiH family protein [Calditrichota bacterium]
MERKSPLPKKPILQLISYSALGIFVFFVPIPIGGKTSIPLDHIITSIRVHLPTLAKWYAFLIVIGGGALTFVNGEWKNSPTTMTFALMKLIGVITATMYVISWGPEFLFAADLLPFLFDKLVIPVGLIVPIGAIFLAFLVDYGLLEFVGVFMQPVMRPFWKTPGRSAIDALASFVGSYSIGLLITNRVFKEGKYSVKEAAIIATGFSTVSATFMIIVAKTCGLMEMWNVYFWSTLLITFAVTAITVRIPPLRNKPAEYLGQPSPESTDRRGNKVQQALEAALNTLEKAPPLPVALRENFLDGIRMAMSILPTIMSVGLLGLLLAKFTPVFTWVGFLFYPLGKLLNIPDALLLSKAVATGIAEMFLPALMVVDAPLIIRFIVAVTSVASIIFFSASVPCILSTEIPITVAELIVIWMERTLCSILLSAVIARFLL